MNSLPELLGPADLPLPELHAARLDGLLYPVAEAFRPIDYPDGATVRASALRRALPGRLVAAEETAAWVWCGGSLAHPLRSYVRPRSRARPEPTAWLVVREIVLHEGDVVTLSGQAVTTALRTACDLARLAQRPRAAELLCHLVASGCVLAEEVESHLRSRRRVPRRAAAIGALARAVDRAARYPELTR